MLTKLNANYGKQCNTFTIHTVLIQTSNQFEWLDTIYDMTSPQTKKVKYEDNFEVFIAWSCEPGSVYPLPRKPITEMRRKWSTWVHKVKKGYLEGSQRKV